MDPYPNLSRISLEKMGKHMGWGETHCSGGLKKREKFARFWATFLFGVGQVGEPVWAYCTARSQDLLPSSIPDLVIPLTLILPFPIRRCRSFSSFFTHLLLSSPRIPPSRYVLARIVDEAILKKTTYTSIKLL